MCASVCWERVKDYSNSTIVRMGFPDNSFRSRLRTRNVRILHVILIVDQSLRRERNRSGSCEYHLRISALSRNHRYCVVFSLRLYARMWTGFLLPLRFRPSPSITSPLFSFFASFSIRPNKSLFSLLSSEHNDVRDSHMQRRWTWNVWN